MNYAPILAPLFAGLILFSVVAVFLALFDWAATENEKKFQNGAAIISIIIILILIYANT